MLKYAKKRHKMRVAIVKLSAMGDIIHAMVALQFIKSQREDITIDWIVEEAFAPVLEGNPDIDNIITVNLKRLKKSKFKIFNEIKEIKAKAKEHYDLVIDAQGLIKSALVAKVFSKNIAGFSKDSIREKLASSFYTQKVDIDYAANTIDRNAKVLGEPLGVEITKEDILNKKPFLFYKTNLELNSCFNIFRKNVVFVIGSTWASRNYPKESFAKLADMLKENVLIVWGNDEERTRAEWIEENSVYAKVLPKLTLNSLKELIARADLVIGNDTGPTHMAWALNTKSITIFGPTPVERVYQTNINKVIKSSSKVNPYKLNKKDLSIREIEPELIHNMAKELL
jgi:heptosyltransferase-1